MDKRLLVQKVVAKLEETLIRLADAARVSAADATDEHNRAENKYDTRATEASYLAAGQGRKALETVQAREAFAALELRDLAPGEPIAPGALVETEEAGGHAWYFLGPSAGGTEVEHDGQEVLVITPSSPLGRELTGKRAGDRLPNGTKVSTVL